MKKLPILFILILNILFSNAQQNTLETTGDILQFALPATALVSTYFYQSDDKPHWQFVKAYVLSVGTTHILKQLIDKQRPNGGHFSFPSGHTTSAFSGATFLQKRYGWNIGVPAYLLASFVGYSRIKANKHDIYDVLAGAGIGIAGGLLFVKPYKKNKINLNLSYNNNLYLIEIQYIF